MCPSPIVLVIGLFKHYRSIWTVYRYNREVVLIDVNHLPCALQSCTSWCQYTRYNYLVIWESIVVLIWILIVSYTISIGIFPLGWIKWESVF